MSSQSQVLLNVDDAEVARYAKHRALRHAGFEVIDASTGAEALRQVEALRPALVLLDVRLPDGNGIEVCRIIKARWPATLVLQTSATFVTANDRARGLEGGADSYLIEPIEPAELVASVRALLRLHAAEAQTREMNETLEQRIEERTEALHQTNLALLDQIAQRERAEAALVQSQKMEAVGQLTSSMAHDFNNILASMLGYIHLARRKAGDPEIRTLLEKAVAAAARGRSLTSRLLAFSRTDQSVTEPVDLGSLVPAMLDWLQQTAGKPIQLAIRTEGADLVAVTDANQVELAILNLVINARDAMPRGGRIDIEVARTELTAADDDLAAGRYVLVSVRDSGEGMAPEVAARAFEPFYTTKPSGRGTGLGLAQVMSVARLSRGTARVDSAEGRGTCISMWLEAGSMAAVPAQVPAAAVLPNDGRRVLLVDDEADIRHTVSDMLAEAGYVVHCAESAADALAAVQDGFAPDILLVDYAMPGMDGVELALKLRAGLVSLPVLFLSGHVDRARVTTAIADARLLRKPFREEELTGEMQSMLRGA